MGRKILSLIGVLTAFLVPVTAAARQSRLAITPETVGDLVLHSRVGYGQVCALAWSPDGRWIAVATTHGLWLHDPLDIEMQPRLIQEVNTWCSRPGFSEGLEHTLLFSQDSGRLISSSSQRTSVYDLTGEPHLLTTISHAPYVRRQVRFDENGVPLLFGVKYDDPALYWRNLERDDSAQEQAASLELRQPDPYISLSPDASRIVIRRDSGNFELVDRQHYEMLATLPVRNGRAVKWSPDGRLVAVPAGEETIIFDAQTGAEAGRIAEPDGAIAWSDDAALLLGRSGIVWDVADAQVRWEHDEFWMDGSAQVKFRVDNSGLFAYFPYPHVSIWTFGDRVIVPEFPALYYNENCCTWVSPAFSPDGAWVALVDDAGRLALVNAVSGEVEGTFHYMNAGERMVISPDGSKLAFQLQVRGYDGRGNEIMLPGVQVIVWDVDHRRSLGMFEPGRVFDFSLDGRQLIALTGAVYGIGRPEDHEIRIIDLSSGNEVERRPYTLENVLQLIPDPDIAWLHVFFPVEGDPSEDRFLALSQSTGVYLAGQTVYDTREGATVGAIQGHDLPITNAAFSPDGSLLITGSYDGSARLWEPTTLEELMVWQLYDPLWDELERIYIREYVSVDFSPDGSLIVIEGNLYDSVSGEKLAAVGGLFSGDGTRMARNTGGVIEIWQIED